MSTELVLDLRGLQPPEPLERILDALDHLERGQELRAVLEREPLPLFRILDRNGYRYTSAARADGAHEVVIQLS